MHKSVGEAKILARGKAPMVFIPHELYLKTVHLIDKVNTQEVQWWHRVDKTQLEDGTVIYALSDLIIPHQEVHAATTEVSPQNWYKTYSEDIKPRFTTEDGTDTEAMNDFIQHLTCWSHSHVNMSATPSSQDKKQFGEFIESKSDPEVEQIFFMMIWNKKGDVYIQVADPANEFIWENPRLVIGQPAMDFSYIDDAVENNVSKLAYRTYGNALPVRSAQGVQTPTVSYQRAQPATSAAALAKFLPQTAGLTGSDRKLFEQKADFVARVADKEQADKLLTELVTALDAEPRALRGMRLLVKSDNESLADMKLYYEWENLDFSVEAGELLKTLNDDWFPDGTVLLHALDVIMFLEKRPTTALPTIIESWDKYITAAWTDTMAWADDDADSVLMY